MHCHNICVCIWVSKNNYSKIRNIDLKKNIYIYIYIFIFILFLKIIIMFIIMFLIIIMNIIRLQLWA